MLQVALTEALVELPQTSSAVPDRVSATEHTSGGIALVSVMLKENPWFGCKPGAAKVKLVTMSRPKTRLVSTMLVSPTLPILVAVATTTSASPGPGNGLTGQALVRARRGDVNTGQVAEIVRLVVRREGT